MPDLPGCFNGPARQLPTVSWQTATTLLYLGAVVSILAYFLYNHAFSKLPVSPVFAAVFDGLLLGEALNWLQSSAILLVSGGVIYSQRPEPTQATTFAFERSP